MFKSLNYQKIFRGGGEILTLLTLLLLLSPVRLLAQSDAKVVYNPTDKTLTFQKGGTVPEGTTVYALNEGNTKPDWSAQKANITKVVIDPSFDVVRPISCTSWFSGFYKMTELQGLEYLHTDAVEYMDYMFNGCSKLTSLDVSHFNTSNVTDMSGMFSGCYNLPSLDLRNFDTSKVTDMSEMFYGCSKITSLDLRNFDTSQVIDMNSMFLACSELTSLNVSSFNTSKVTDMSDMFESCEKLPSLDIRNFDTSNVKTIYKMFAYCYALPTIDLSHFNTSNVESMGYLFYKCYSLKELDLSNFDTSKTNPDDYGLTSMFEYCKSLETIYVGDKFVITGEDDWMFGDCFNLVGAKKYDENKTGSDMANNQTGYLKKYNKYGEKKGEKVELYGYKAHYLRNHTYEWATMCLPFAFSTADNAAYRFYALKSVSADALSVTPLSGTIAAGTPVFVRGANAAGNRIEIVGVDDVLVETALTQSGDGVEFTGTFGDVRGISDANYIIMQDKFWLAGDLRNSRPSSSVNVAALRAYLVPTTGGASHASVLNICAEDGNITGIASAETTGNDNTEIYDAQGRRLNGLQHGLNIVRTGGKTKKIIVK